MCSFDRSGDRTCRRWPGCSASSGIRPPTSGRLIGADDDGELIGVAALGVLPMLEVTGRIGRVLALVVDERYRGRGVGQSLVTAAEEQARAAGCLKMEVTSSRYRTRTHKFYQQLGYEDICASSARFVKSLAVV
jgi:GNAT superfamily N-acetyltransferase